MATPTFYPEGNTPKLFDTQRRIEMKILGAIIDSAPGSGATDYATGGNFSGSGSPEGAVIASPGAVYLDTATGSLWSKRTGTGTNTGWLQQIA